MKFRSGLKRDEECVEQDDELENPRPAENLVEMIRRTVNGDD